MWYQPALREESMDRARCAVALTLLAVFAWTAPARAAESSPRGSAVWDSVGRVLQTPNVFAGGYHRFNLPRRDVTLHLKDVTVAPELALGAWAGFSDDAEHAMLMGDLVLLSTELSRVLVELSRRGIAVTAIHNHLVGEDPKTRISTSRRSTDDRHHRRLQRARSLRQGARECRAALVHAGPGQGDHGRHDGDARTGLRQPGQ